MDTSSPLSRRSFIKLGAAGAAASAFLPSSIMAADVAGNAWTTKKVINPVIDNMRVVSCYNSTVVSMISAGQSYSANIKTDMLAGMMDMTAMTLTQKSTADEAWAAIFQKPAAKDWSAVKVAFKINVSTQPLMTHVPVISKVIAELNKLGVVSSNIYLYDAHTSYWPTDSGNWTTYTGAIGRTGLQGLPTGVHTGTQDILGGWASVPSGTGSGNYNVAKGLTDGTIDILINMPVNKGHGGTDSETSGERYGGATCTFKNHGGTFESPCSSNGSGAPKSNCEYLVAINKHSAILGGTPVRQQLCICDSLWGMKFGPGWNGTTIKVDMMPKRIVMGVFGGAVDWAVTKKIREPDKTAPMANYAVIDRFMTDFGYATTDLNYIDITYTGTSVGQSSFARNAASGITLAVAGQRFALPVEPDNRPYELALYSVNGWLVRSFGPVRAGKEIVWDGRSALGKKLTAGRYLLKATQERRLHSMVVSVM